MCKLPFDYFVIVDNLKLVRSSKAVYEKTEISRLDHQIVYRCVPKYVACAVLFREMRPINCSNLIKICRTSTSGARQFILTRLQTVMDKPLNIEY
jgi:hypothetical protein